MKKTKPYNPRDRIKKTVPVYSYNFLYLEGTIEDAIKTLQSEQELHKDKENLRISYDYGEERKDYYLVYDRMETDQEYAERMKQLEVNENWQRQQYEALKKKFEGT